MKDKLIFQASVNYIINFLYVKFDKWLQYKISNSLTSAISAYHVHIDGKSVGKHPKVCALLAGIFNQNIQNLDMFFYGIWR